MTSATRTLSYLAGRPEASPEFLSAALATLDLSEVPEYSYPAALLRAVASHPSTPAGDLVRLSTLPGSAGEVAKNPAAPVEALLGVLSTRDVTLVRSVLSRPVWPVEVVSWARSRMARTGPLSAAVIAGVLENLEAPADLVELALSAALVHPLRSSAEEREGSIAAALGWRLRRDEGSQERWARSLTDLDCLRTLFGMPGLSEVARRRIFDVAVVIPQQAADEVFWRSRARDVPPPLLRDVVPLIRQVLHDRVDALGVFVPLAMDLVRSHDLSGVPYEHQFVSALERAAETSDEELSALVAAGDRGALEGLVARQRLPHRVALELVAARHVPTDLARRATAAHLRHSSTEEALRVRSWDRVFVVETLVAMPGLLRSWSLDPDLGLEVLEGLAVRSQGMNDARLVSDHLDLVPVERWGELSWSLVQAALPYSPELASRVLGLFSGEFPTGGWEVFAHLVGECPDFPGTLGELAASVSAIAS